MIYKYIIDVLLLLLAIFILNIGNTLGQESDEVFAYAKTASPTLTLKGTTSTSGSLDYKKTGSVAICYVKKEVEKSGKYVATKTNKKQNTLPVRNLKLCNCSLPLFLGQFVNCDQTQHFLRTYFL